MGAKGYISKRPIYPCTARVYTGCTMGFTSLIYNHYTHIIFIIWYFTNIDAWNERPKWHFCKHFRSQLDDQSSLLWPELIFTTLLSMVSTVCWHARCVMSSMQSSLWHHCTSKFHPCMKGLLFTDMMITSLLPSGGSNGGDDFWRFCVAHGSRALPSLVPPLVPHRHTYL